MTTESKDPKRTPVARYGDHGHRVYVFAEKCDNGETIVRVQWADTDGKRKTQSFNTGSRRQKEVVAKQFAQAKAQELSGTSSMLDANVAHAPKAKRRDPKVVEALLRSGTSVTERRTLQPFGGYGWRVNTFDLVTTFPDGTSQAVTHVEWKFSGKRFTRRFTGPENERHAAAFRLAEETARLIGSPIEARQTEPQVGLSMRDLWKKYLVGKRVTWRPKSLKLYEARWKVFTLHMDADMPAEKFNGQNMNEYRDKLFSTPTKRGVPMAGNQVAKHLELIKQIFGYAVEHGILTKSPVKSYVVRKGDIFAPMDVAEYHPTEWRAILSQLNRKSILQWRAWASLALTGLLAVRIEALVQLRWEWIDFSENTITWPWQIIKNKKNLVHPMNPEIRMVLKVCKLWARREGYAGDFVFFSRYEDRKDGPISKQTVWYHLQQASRRAGVQAKPFRAMHGLRRMRGREIFDKTKNLLSVGLWLGNSDIRTLKKSYLKARPEDYEDILKAVTL